MGHDYLHLHLDWKFYLLLFLLLTLLQISLTLPTFAQFHPAPPLHPVAFTTLLSVSMGYAYMFFG